VGLSLYGGLLSEDGARFASQLGVSDVVVHLTDYARNADTRPYLEGDVGPINGECIGAPLWSYDERAALVAMLGRHRLRVAAMENISPNFWSDVLLDGPARAAQMEGLKRLVRDAGRAGIPVIGYNCSLAGVWGWRRQGGRAAAPTRPCSRWTGSTPRARSRTGWWATCATGRAARARHP
jgi:mannonate dehydratase